jgi:hypothetical protein
MARLVFSADGDAVELPSLFLHRTRPDPPRAEEIRV